MANDFFEHPILNSPYEYPSRHWELDEVGQPTQKVIARRRDAKFITPIPKPKKRKAAARYLAITGLGQTADSAYPRGRQGLRSPLKRPPTSKASAT